MRFSTNRPSMDRINADIFSLFDFQLEKTKKKTFEILRFPIYEKMLHEYVKSPFSPPGS
jgi:hypothetical protein